MTNLLLAAQILVGVTGYGNSPERFELQTNDQCNLWIQWEHSGNLLPKNLGQEWFDWAKSNRVHVMTIYGGNNPAMIKQLREVWGDLYLGNNIGEYAGFLYQDERSYLRGWPKLQNLKEARDWLTGTMLHWPKEGQLKLPPEGRQPFILSTSGSPLAAYELQGGIDIICNEMYAVGCGNLAYATAEARGASRRLQKHPYWSAWLAHEWQTCWPRVPYGVAQKFDSLEVGLKEMWLMGTSMMVLESGSQGTQAHQYTPPDGSMEKFSSERQKYDGPAPKAYRRTMGEFYRWTKAHPRAKGEVETPAALLLGNCDGYVGMTWDTFAVFGQHHLAKTNANWRCGAPEFTWEAVMETFFPRPLDALKPFANGWLGGTPHGQLDVVTVDEKLTPDKLERYRVVAFGGWNSMTPVVAKMLRDYVQKGGTVVLATPHLSSRLDREFTHYTTNDLVRTVPGVEVTGSFLSEDILMVKPSAPAFLREAYPAYISAKMRLAKTTLAPDVEVLATMGKAPYLVRVRHGKGYFYLVLAWDYPAARREFEDYPSYRNLRLDFWKTLLVGLVRQVQPYSVEGEGAPYINWAVWPDRVYLLNTDCVSPRTIRFGGRELRFEPKELKEIPR